MHRHLARLLLSLVCLAAACARQQATEPPRAHIDPGEHAFFDGDGRPADFAAFVAGLADVDLIAFGEMHFHPLANRYELALLEGVAAQPRPVALALEFFERDHQPAIDAYLAGEIDEATFRERTGRDGKYDESHRPLVEFCKQRRIPVLAANAPRRLVTAYRKSDAADYQTYLRGLSEEDRGDLPRASVPPDDAFKDRFMAFMGPKRGPAFYRSMALWNDAMAETTADFRAAHPEHRVLFVVGAFHVAARLGAITQYLARRPDDRVRVLVMQSTEGPMVASPSDRGEGDLVLKVRDVDSAPAS